MSMFSRLDNRGVTIIEVLLTIAIAGAVLGGAYASANRSLSGTMMSKERTEGLQFAQEQLEMLKSALLTPDKKAMIVSLPENREFCMTTNTWVEENAKQGDGSWSAACLRGPDGRYRMFIQKESDEKFTIKAAWDRIGGGEEQHVTIVYKAYVP